MAHTRLSAAHLQQEEENEHGDQHSLESVSTEGREEMSLSDEEPTSSSRVPPTMDTMVGSWAPEFVLAAAVQGHVQVPWSAPQLGIDNDMVSLDTILHRMFREPRGATPPSHSEDTGAHGSTGLPPATPGDPGNHSDENGNGDGDLDVDASLVFAMLFNPVGSSHDIVM